MRATWVLFAVLLLIPRAAAAQGDPVGPEFRVNAFTSNSQSIARIAADSSGNFFVVAWTSLSQDGSGYGVFGQRYDANTGTPLGPEFRVNTYTTGGQDFPSVASDSAGNFVVVWRGYGPDGSASGILGQRYSSSGSPQGTEFRVNTYTTNSQRRPWVAVGPSGDFVVVWTSVLQDGSGSGIFGQRFASSGTPQGAEFRVNTYTTGDQYFHSNVALDPSGNFVVVWTSYPQDGSSAGVFAQRFASSGAPQGPEFRVNSYTTGTQRYPFVAADSGGNFVVVWASADQDGAGEGVFGQRFDASGSPLGQEFRVNTYTTGGQRAFAAAADAAGNFVVVWDDDASHDGSGVGVFGQRYASSGSPLGPEFQINTYVTNNQAAPTVAADGAGRFVVVWNSLFQDGSSTGVFGQRYNVMVPVELMQFRVE
jgi:hypothetical protein